MKDERDEPLWTAEALAAATGGTWLVAPPPGWAPTGLTYQRKWFRDGDLVLPLGDPLASPGDPALHLLALARSGAAAGVVVTQAVEGLPEGFPQLQVESVYRARQELARARRAEFAGKVFGVTGTVGKTTTREMIKHVMGKRGPATSNNANYNCIEGCANALARAPRGGSAAVLEMAICFRNSSVQAMSQMASPDVAIVTMVDRAHLDYFEDTAAIAEHKAGIFDGLRPGGTAVINRGIKEYARVRARAEASPAGRVVTYGAHPEADYRLLGGDYLAEPMTIRAAIDGREVTLVVGVSGEHMAVNALGVVAAVVAAGVPLEEALAGLADFSATHGRMARTTLPLPGAGDDAKDSSFELINDSFNAAPASMRACLAVLGGITPGPGGRRIAVLGDIAHLGDRTREEHEALAEPVREAGVELLLLVGRHMARLRDVLAGELEVHHFALAEELAAHLLGALRPGDVVAVKGSIPARLERVADALTRGVAPAIPARLKQPIRERARANQRHSAMVCELTTGRVLLDHKAASARAPGHFVQLMLAYVLFQAVEEAGATLDAEVEIPRGAAEVSGRWGFAPGSRASLQSLVSAMLIGPAHDAAYALAAHLGGVAACVARMNAAAKALGMRATRYANITGALAKEQVTTAADTIRLALLLLHTFPQHAELFGQRSCAAAGKTMGTRNTFLYEHEGALGMHVARIGKTHAILGLVRCEPYVLMAVSFGHGSERSRDAVMVDLMEWGALEAAKPTP